MNSWQLDQALHELQDEHPILERLRTPDDPIRDAARRLFSDGQNGMGQIRESFCSAHSGMYIFDAFGDIYACWERTGDASVRIGRVMEDGSVDLNEQLLDMWQTRTVASNPVCSKCRYAFNCGGGCAVLAQGRTGQYHMNYCDAFSSRFRASVADAYQRHLAGESMVENADLICDQ